MGKLGCCKPLLCALPHPALQELWQLLISANETGTGIPQRMLDEKQAEIQRQREEAERIQVRQQA